MLIDVCGSNKTEKQVRKYTKFSSSRIIFSSPLLLSQKCPMDILHYPLATLQVRGSDARFLGYEEPEDECEGDPEEDLLQELLLLVLRRPRTSVVSWGAIQWKYLAWIWLQKQTENRHGTK